MKQKVIVLLSLIFIFCVLPEMKFVQVGRANPMPSTYAKLTLDNPQNMTYNTNTFYLKFTADFLEWSFSSDFNFFYSLDTKKLHPIENITTTYESGIPINPGFIQKIMKGNCSLTNLSNGRHNLTIYQIGYKEKLYATANTKFHIKFTETEGATEQMFNLTLPYCYLITKNGTFEDLTGPDLFGNNESLVESCALSLVLNYTLNDYPENQTIGAVVEYFKIVVESVDKSIITQMSESTAIVKNDLFKERVREFDRNSRDDHFSTALMGGGGVMAENWTVGEFHLTPTISVNTATIGYQTEAAKVRRAENVMITVYYLGKATFTDNTTEIVTATNQIVQLIQLEKYEEGWLYNNFIPENELEQTNLLKPMPDMEHEIVPEFPTGSVTFGILALMLVVIITKKKIKPR